MNGRVDPLSGPEPFQESALLFGFITAPSPCSVDPYLPTAQSFQDRGMWVEEELLDLRDVAQKDARGTRYLCSNIQPFSLRQI